MPKNRPVWCLPVLLALVCTRWNDRTAQSQEEDIRLRRPIRLLLVDDGKTLLVAHRDSGTISAVDTERLHTVREAKFGRRLADMTATHDGSKIAVVNEDTGEFVLLARQGLELRELSRVPVGTSPVSVRLSADGQWAVVASLWPRRLAFVDMAAVAKMADAKAVSHLDLPFAPRRLLFVNNSKLLVADSFGGKLAVVDVPGKKVDSLRDLPAHNIRGLALARDRKTVILAHQFMFATGRPNPGQIQSGDLISNKLTFLLLDDLLRPGADIWRNGRSHDFGDIEQGAGDPGDVAQGPSGETIVSLSGTQELAIGWPEKATWQRLGVGRRPTDLAIDAKRQRAYIANTFDDSISVIDLDKRKVLSEVRLSPTPSLRAEERGEVLFHDARLSFEAWFSCHSCHTDGHANGLLNDNFTDGSFGTPKRVLSLLGVNDTAPWAWGGQMAKLETQVHSSITSTMQGKTPKEEQVRDIVAYLQTLKPAPAQGTARGTLDKAAFERGRKVFEQQSCAACHAPPTYSTPKTYDVGIHSAGATHFNPPSLRGLSQGGPYFHDGRAQTLAEIFTRYQHRLTEPLGEKELADLLEFLRGL
ncbi:MAG: c-type cytochrome [Gemmataceae bacterium]|nr:c-type cytochrome [Gemmataceae bacterium]